MGMDLYGNAPRSDRGKHFRNSVWWWHPLAHLCKRLAPEIANRCKDWHSNTGAGLDRKSARKLGTKLEQLIREGAVERYCLEIRLDLVYGLCPICLGDGAIKLMDAENDQGVTLAGYLHDTREGKVTPCTACRQIGYLNPASRQHYEASVENVREFAAFCRNCGGFEIR